MVTDGTRMIYYHLHMCEIFYHARFICVKDGYLKSIPYFSGKFLKK